MQGGEEQPGLAEVKDVLRKLQRLDFPEQGGESGLDSRPDSGEERSDVGGAPSRAVIGVFDRKHAAVTSIHRKAGSTRRITSYIAGALALTISACAILIWTGVVKVPENLGKKASGESAPRQETQVALVTDARRTLNLGDVLSARNILLGMGPDARADIAFMLAQSYDPNYLQTLQKTNGLPDVSQARRWYEKWYELAVKSGLEMDSERLQRIIKSMH